MDLKICLLMGLVLTVSACGGGGGSGTSQANTVTSPQPTLKINSTNAGSVASTSLSSDTVTTNVGGITVLSTSQTTSTTIKLTDFTRQLLHLDQYQTLQPQLFETLCVSGSVTEPPAGSTSGSYVFNNCDTGSLVLNGTISFSISGTSNNYTATVSYSNFVFSGLSSDSTVNATLTITYSYDGTNKTITSSIPEFDLTVNSDYIHLYNFTMTVTTDSSLNTTTDFDYTFDSSFINGIVRVTTATAEGGQSIQQNAGDPYPYSGSVVVIGNASRVRVTAQGDGSSSGTVLIEVDENGDGIYDTSSTPYWSDFSSLSSI